MPSGRTGTRQPGRERYRRLPTGTHGLDREEVRRDQRERLRTAMIELTARVGYRKVRILDITRLARVSRPTFYELYADKETLFLDAYDDVARRVATVVVEAYREDGTPAEHLLAGVRAGAELAAAEPEAMSLFALGAFGAGERALERRKQTLAALERVVSAGVDAGPAPANGVIGRMLIGGAREVVSARLRAGRAAELPAIAGDLAAWASCYPLNLPRALRPPGSAPPAQRARRRATGPLPSGRHALPRSFILQNQRERIVDATAATITAKGLSGLTIPEIARRANVSHQTFYELYPTKDDAYLGALKISLHQALRVTAAAYEAELPDWPRAVAAGVRALIEFIASEPEYAHLSLVDTFAANPRAIEIREQALLSFRGYLQPGYAYARNGRAAADLAAEAVTGGLWQILHDHVDEERICELAELVPGAVYATLVPFIGTRAAAQASMERATRR